MANVSENGAPGAPAHSGVRVEIDGAVATITIGGGEPLNTLTDEVLDGIESAIDAVASDAAARVAILRGAGRRSFASGMDLKILRQLDPAGAQAHFEQLNRCLRKIEQAPFPVIAMIYGFAVGGGYELAAACDLRVAGSSARIGVPIGRLGHCADRENLRRLLRLLSPAHVKAMVMTDALFGADEAHRMGAFNWVVPDSSLEAFTLSIATTASQKSPLGMRALKHAINEVLDGSIAHAEDPADDLITSLWATRDFQEGVSAFFERRTPDFKGC